MEERTKLPGRRLVSVGQDYMHQDRYHNVLPGVSSSAPYLHPSAQRADGLFGAASWM